MEKNKPIRRYHIIKKLIVSFYENRFSEEGQRIFTRWLSHPKEQKEKEQVLRNLWNHTPSVANSHTVEDWKHIKKSISYSSTHSTTRPVYKPHTYLYPALHIAAVLLLMLVSATIAWMVRDSQPTSDTSTLTGCFTSYGERRNITLEDGTQVWLNSGSQLLYPKNFDQCDRRIVYLNGEAHFDVYKNPQKPFIVRTPQVNIQALGTQFMVEAYLNENETRTTLEEGCIQVDICSESQHPSFILSPGEQLAYNHTDSSTQVKHIDIEQFLLTREGYLIFENASFVHLVKSLERRYGVTIQYNSGKYEHGQYNVKFTPQETLEEALEVLKELMDIKYHIKKNTIYIK